LIGPSSIYSNKNRKEAGREAEGRLDKTINPSKLVGIMGVLVGESWLFVCFHVLSVGGMGAAGVLALLALCQAYVLRQRLNLVMQAYLGLVLVECSMALVLSISSILALADRTNLLLLDEGR
jgi:hypothetical protein